jgi:cell wall-associated NlpC family hydrolase
MATIGNVRWDDIEPGDLLLYDGNGDGTVDHVDTYIGAGWALDSGSSNAGVTITRVANSWYEDHFVHARHVIGV